MRQLSEAVIAVVIIGGVTISWWGQVWCNIWYLFSWYNPHMSESSMRKCHLHKTTHITIVELWQRFFDQLNIRRQSPLPLCSPLFSEDLHKTSSCDQTAAHLIRYAWIKGQENSVSVVRGQFITWCSSSPVKTGSAFFCASYSFLKASKASGEIPEGWSAMLVALPMFALRCFSFTVREEILIPHWTHWTHIFHAGGENETPPKPLKFQKISQNHRYCYLSCA